MKFVDEILEIVKMTPIASLDLAFVKSMDPQKVYLEMMAKPGYKTLIDVMAVIQDDAKARGMDPKTASAVILSTHEDILRYVIMKAVKERLSTMAIDQVLNLEKAMTIDQEMAKVEGLKKDMANLESSYKMYADKLPINQFRYSLKYAADKWGNETEKIMVNSLIKKIKEVVVKK